MRQIRRRWAASDQAEPNEELVELVIGDPVINEPSSESDSEEGIGEVYGFGGEPTIIRLI